MIEIECFSSGSRIYINLGNGETYIGYIHTFIHTYTYSTLFMLQLILSVHFGKDCYAGILGIPTHLTCCFLFPTMETYTCGRIG